MGKYFGTDGIRGEINKNLTANMAFKVGEYIGYYCKKNNIVPNIVIGKDTRQSSSMLESAIAAGASSTGVNSFLIGYCPTPCVSFNVNKNNFSFGIMISASHNPYHDNGIKIFNSKGYKLEEIIENEIENYIDGKIDIEYARNDAIGCIETYQEGMKSYLDNLVDMFKIDLTGFRVLVDCSNGSASMSAEYVLKKLNATCTIICDQPDGLNINKDCGSTHIEKLEKNMIVGEYDLGLSFDGDADRLIAVTPSGRIIDGDHILYILGKYMLEKNQLNKNVIVTTVMANIGLLKALDESNVKYIQTPVGDKYVFEQLNNNDYSLGGEQSGHIILPEYSVSGDGLLTALKLIEVIIKSKININDLVKDLTIYPQVLKNIRVLDKEKSMNDREMLALVNKISKELGNNGQILVRCSGTEPLVRVMVEASSSELCEKYANSVIEIIKSNNK